jgi:hypothetical protein
VNPNGAQIVNVLLKAMEDMRAELVVSARPSSALLCAPRTHTVPVSAQPRRD